MQNVVNKKITFESVWADIANLFSKVGDIGKFNVDDFEVCDEAKYSWSGDKWPIDRKSLEEISALGLHSIATQGIYATLARRAAKNFVDSAVIYTAIGEVVGSLVSGWSGRFGNILDIEERLENEFCFDGYRPSGYTMSDFFENADVQVRIARMVEKAKELHNEQYG